MAGHGEDLDRWDDDRWDDVVEVGSTQPRHRSPRWLLVGFAVFAVLVAYAVSGGAGADDPAADADERPPAPTPTSSLDLKEQARGPFSAPHLDRPVVEELDGPLLGAEGSWEIVALTPESLVRIQPGRGRVVRTAVPDLDSTGPLSFVAGTDAVLVRPWDFVQGYLITDGRPAGEPPPHLDRGGPAFPGPAPDQVWVQAGSDDQRVLELVGLDGRSTGHQVRLPASSWPLAPDGTGKVLFGAIGGIYVAGTDGIHRVTTGTVLATGRTRLLTLECDEQARCSRVVVERPLGTRRVLGRSDADRNAFPGAVSADGRTAAFVGSSRDGPPVLRLVDLDSGADHTVEVGMGDGYGGAGTLAWSPDGRWLFLATGREGLQVVDTDTGRSRDLGVDLPQTVTAVAVRRTG